MNIYDFVVKKRNGEDLPLSKFKGKVILIVNTATGCGFTPQYEGLEELYKKYHDRGLEILDFPCNQFANQAPGTDEEIHKFCKLKYDTSFDQLAKIEVNGKNEHPLYTFLKKEKSGMIFKRVKWNFEKFLVDRDGNVVYRFASTTKPKNFEDSIVELLG